MRLRKQRWIAEAVEPRRAGETSRIIMAAGARQASLSANPTSSAANDCWYSGDSSDTAIIGAAATDAPARGATQPVQESALNLLRTASEFELSHKPRPGLALREEGYPVGSQAFGQDATVVSCLHRSRKCLHETMRTCCEPLTPANP